MRKLKVLHVSYSDHVGGASVAMFRIHRSLVDMEVNSEVFVLVNDSGKIDVISFKKGINKFLHKVILKLGNILVRLLQKTKFKTTRSLNLFSTGFVNFINKSDCDIVHLHWIGANAIGVKELSYINKTIVWTMHDLWAILGSEHNNVSNDTRYKYGYRKNNRIFGYLGLDIERYIWNLKKRYWNNLNLSIVAVSSWQTKIIQESMLFKSYPVACIHNPIDINRWFPIEKQICRSQLGFGEDEIVLLYGAFNFVVDPIKGYEKLIESLSLIPNKNDIVIAYFGSDVDVSFGEFKSINYGKIYDVDTLRSLYSASDVFLMPSLQETFGQTALEAICCNLPVVAFQGTGTSDIIIHKKNGYLARENEVSDFAMGVQWLLDNRLEAVRETAIGRFDANFIGLQYLKLYNSII
jgi:glycosyltransferase involved in cell wall biosynthesis